MKERYLHPLTDFGFKKLFGSETHKHFLINFLNQLLPERHQIENLTYIKNEHLGNTPIDRKAVFDLYCESQNGDKFIVEVQKARQRYFRDRSIYYSTFPIQKQAVKGSDWNFQLAAVYTIAIIDFSLDVPNIAKRVIHTVNLKDQDNEVFYDKLSYIYIELPNFTKEPEELTTLTDKWLYTLRHLAKLQDRPIALQERIFERFFEAAEIAHYSVEEQRAYQDSLKAFRDIRNSLDTAKEEGREEERYVIAKNLKQTGTAIEIIAKATGLSVEEIEKL